MLFDIRFYARRFKSVSACLSILSLVESSSALLETFQNNFSPPWCPWEFIFGGVPLPVELCWLILGSNQVLVVAVCCGQVWDLLVVRFAGRWRDIQISLVNFVVFFKGDLRVRVLRELCVRKRVALCENFLLWYWPPCCRHIQSWRLTLVENITLQQHVDFFFRRWHLFSMVYCA